MSDDKAFVVMQIGAKDSPERKRADEIFNYIVTPALQEVSLTAYRADLDPAPGAVTPKLLKELLEARLVIADLTGRNPNVFYELGIAHSFARPLISIADSPESLPFDAKDERVIALGIYPESGLAYAQGEAAKKALTESLRVVLEDGYEPPSPLKELAGSRSLDALAPSNPVASELGQIGETLDVILEHVRRPRRTYQMRPDAIEDMKAMRSALEKLLAEAPGVLDKNDLITESTSAGHDEWVAEHLPATPKVPDWVSGANTPPSPNYDEPPF